MNKLYRNIIQYLFSSQDKEIIIEDNNGKTYRLLGCGSSSAEPGIVRVKIEEETKK